MGIQISSDKPRPGRCYFCRNIKPLVVCLPGATDHKPCEECADFMKRGVIFMSVRDGETDDKNPCRAGGFAVLTSDVACKILGTEMLVEVLAKRYCFVEESVWGRLGLPRYAWKAARRDDHVSADEPNEGASA
jgi:hypothetical protein